MGTFSTNVIFDEMSRRQRIYLFFFQTVVSQSVSVEEKSILSLGYLQYQCTEKSIVCLHNYNSIHGNMITREH